MTQYLNKDTPLKNRLEHILTHENIEAQRQLIKSISADLVIDSDTCAAALLYLTQSIENPQKLKITPFKTHETIVKSIPVLLIKMVRYRLNIGSEQSITAEQLKKVLIEESGVDKNNINNINIQRTYTLIELPDEMPPDIFQHLKSVEINQHKLDIKRLKSRNNKKRGNNHLRRNRKREPNDDLKTPEKTNASAKKVD